MISIIISKINHPISLLGSLLIRTRNLWPDKTYIKFMYRVMKGYCLDLENPIRFSEKLQWLKLYNRKPEYTIMVDKIEAKNYVKNILGKEHIIPTIGVWSNPDEIDFSELPQKFVLKCNHNSGIGMYICRDKNSIDENTIKKELRKGLSEDYFLKNREWPYKDVPRKILAETFIETANSDDLKDYKFFCFDGVVKFFKIDFDRFTDHHANYYTTDGKLLPNGEAEFPPKYDHYEKIPENLSEMIAYAEKLSKNIPFVRIDFYDVDGKVYFGEITFFPSSGFGRFIPEDWDIELGKMLKLPQKN